MDMRGRRADWRRRARATTLSPDEGAVRRIGWQLAGLTAVMLCVLVLALGVVVYRTMQVEILHTMQTALHDRAASQAPHLSDEIGQPEEPNTEERPSNGVFVVFANPALTLVDADDGSPFGQALPDRVAAQVALRSRAPRFSTRADSPNQHYLIYTDPIVRNGQVQGVLQTGLLEGPYTASLHVLVQALLFSSGLGLAAVAAISAVLVHRSLRPIRTALRRQRDFVADAAHELRTPLTILRSAAELGLASVADHERPEDREADQQAAFEQTLVQSNHLTRLVEDLSLLARVDSGALRLERTPVDLGQVVTEMIGGVDMLAEDRGIHLDVVQRENVRVLGDAGRLHQLLLILLDNALKHTPDGGAITVTVEQTGAEARVRVRDSGPGIAPRDLLRIFDRFYRIDRARNGAGSGLGLSIGRWIAEAHGGRITAANAPDHGAVFTVTLPLAR